jgi:glutamate dehydrogenase
VGNELLKSDQLRFPDNDALLADYFPETITKRFRDAIDNHLLLKELLATIRTNAIFKFAGSAFFPDLVIETDRSVSDVTVAYTIASHCLGAARLRKQLLDDLERDGRTQVTPSLAEARHVAVIEVEDALREATSWLLHFLPENLLWSRAALAGRPSRSTGRAAADRSKAASPSQYPAALEALQEYLPKAAPNAWQRVGREAARMQDLGLPEAMAKEVGLTNQWPKVFLIAELHERTKCPIPDVARVYLTLGQSTRLNAIILRIGRQPAADVWEALALRSLRASLLRFLSSLRKEC